jgi:hypothetical protein
MAAPRKPTALKPFPSNNMSELSPALTIYLSLTSGLTQTKFAASFVAPVPL